MGDSALQRMSGTGVRAFLFSMQLRGRKLRGQCRCVEVTTGIPRSLRCAFSVGILSFS